MKEKCVISILLDGTASVQTSSLWIRGRSCSVALWLSVVISFLFSSVVNGFYNLQHSQFCLTTCLRIQRMNNNNQGKKVPCHRPMFLSNSCYWLQHSNKQQQPQQQINTIVIENRAQMMHPKNVIVSCKFHGKLVQCKHTPA